MLSANEFNEWVVRNNITQESLRMILKIRNLQFNSIKNIWHGLDDTLKYLATDRYEADNDVLEYHNYPLIIPTEHYITPNFFVIRRRSAGFEEWKTETELIKLSQSIGRYITQGNNWVCPTGVNYAKRLKLYYKIKTLVGASYL